MLKVFEWQLDVMSDAYFDALTRDHVAFLRDVLPVETAAYDDEALAALAVRGRRSAERHDIDRGHDIERYLCLMVLLGHDFDTEVEWARETFAREDFTGQVRMDVVWSIHEGRDDIPAGTPYLP